MLNFFRYSYATPTVGTILSSLFWCSDNIWHPSIHSSKRLSTDAGAYTASRAIGRETPWTDGQSITGLTQTYTLSHSHPRAILVSHFTWPACLWIMGKPYCGDSATHWAARYLTCSCKSVCVPYISLLMSFSHLFSLSARAGRYCDIYTFVN